MALTPQNGNMTVPAQPVRGSAGPVAVGKFIAPIAGKTLSRGGAAMAGLLSHWAAISGPSLADHTMPAKLTRGPSEPDFQGKTGASLLHLKVDPAKALEVQYAIPQLVERINQTLGYRAVAGIRLVQAPVYGRPRAPARKRASIGAAPASPPVESRLGSALARMAAGVKARHANAQ